LNGEKKERLLLKKLDHLQHRRERLLITAYPSLSGSRKENICYLIMTLPRIIEEDRKPLGRKN